MANYEIYDYLTTITPDYVTTEFAAGLTFPPQGVVFEDGGKNIITHVADDGSEQRIAISTKSVFWVSMQWNNIGQSDAGEILDYYHNTAKACGGLYSFYWTHATDGHTYVTRFTGRLRIFKQNNALWGVAPFQLKILGRKAD